MYDATATRPLTSLATRIAAKARCAGRLADAWLKPREYKDIYRQSYAAYLRQEMRAPAADLDLCLVLPRQSEGWILHAICREIEQRMGGAIAYGDDLAALPPARAYYISHYSFLLPVLVHNPRVWGARRVVLFTHPRELSMSEEAVIHSLNQCTKVVSMSRLFSEQLIERGVRRRRVDTATMGADPTLFRPHTRTGQGAIGFCTAFYPRKDPDRILAIVAAMPHRRFILMGRNWSNWERFGELASLKNLEIREGPYAEYPAFYDQLDVFVSPGRVEGGPIPLIEAMMSNVVPVASRTGFAPEVIAHGKTGFVFDTDAAIETICRYIDQAYEIRADVRRTVEHLTWDRFVRQIAPHLGGPVDPDLLPGTYSHAH